MATPNRAFLKASLALWKRRERYRRKRHDAWQKKVDQARDVDKHPRQTLINQRNHWTRLLKQARDKIKQRERQLGQDGHANGIDASNNNGHVAWSAVARAGYRFAWVKATEGQSFRDGLFLANVRGAKKAGLRAGAYHFLRPSTGGSPVGEARAFAKAIRGAGLGKGDLVPVVDVEVSAFGAGLAAAAIPVGEGHMGVGYHEVASATLGFEPEAAAAGGTEAYVASFVAELERLLGVRPLIYTFPAFMRWTSTHGCGLWIANFGVAAPSIPSPWKGYVVWQHSSTAHVPGVAGNCDVNVTGSFGGLVW